MTTKSDTPPQPRRLDSKARPLLIIVPLALGPPLGTWIAMQWFQMSFMAAAFAAIICTLAVGFPAKWLVDFFSRPPAP